jgi:hypothetical protein
MCEYDLLVLVRRRATDSPERRRRRPLSSIGRDSRRSALKAAVHEQTRNRCRNGAAQLVVAPDAPPFAGTALRACRHLCDGVTSVAGHFLQKRLSGAATAAPRRLWYVERRAGERLCR